MGYTLNVNDPDQLDMMVENIHNLRFKLKKEKGKGKKIDDCTEEKRDSHPRKFEKVNVVTS